jgi:hypothetical protein
MKRKDEERGPHDVPIPSVLLAQMREWRRADGDDADYVCLAAWRRRCYPEAVEKFYRRGFEIDRQTLAPFLAVGALHLG